MSDSELSLETRVAFLVPLNKLTPDRQNRLLQQSDVLTLRKREKLFQQGDRDDFTFYLLEGEIEMFADDSLIKRVVGGEGASFQPLAQLQPRQMSAVAKTRAQVLRVRRSLLEQLLSVDEAGPAAPTGSGVEAAEIDAIPASDWLLALLQSDLFKRIPPAHIQALLDALESVEFSAGAVVIKQGEPGDYFYIVQRGSCEVTRTGANGRDIRLATLGPGDTFGEEALVSGTARNATVRMITDGALARLTQDRFSRLILAPLLDGVSRAEADARIAAGARWLDVRFEDEHAHNGLPDSLNIPLSMLRTRLAELPTTTSYVVYCDTGGRSSAGAFLLAERGYDVCYVVGGAVHDELPATAPAPTSPTTARAASDGVLEASALAGALEAELERARFTIDRAQQMMADASAMKADAERIVAQQLAAERSRIGTETATLAQKLAEAERLRSALAEQEQAARQAAAHQQRALEEHVQALEADARERLLEEQRRLAALYRKQTETLESLQADRESELRTQLEQELAAERSKLTQQFLHTTAALEQAREERRLALAARDAATVEAQALIAEFKAQQQQLLDAQQAAFDRERTRLQAEAVRIEALREDATRARYEAEAARDAAYRALDEARAAHAAAREPRATLDAFEQRVAVADHELQQALAAETAAETAVRDTQDVLSRTYDNTTEISLLLQKELDDWVAEQTRLQESTLQRETRSKQQAMIDRIRSQTSATKQAREQQTKTLLDEIAQQLHGGDTAG